MKNSIALAAPAVAILVAVAVCLLVRFQSTELSPSVPTASDNQESRLEFRSAVKYVIGRDVLEGRRTLVEGAAFYGWLNSLDPPSDVKQASAWLVGLPTEDRVYSREELLCCQVVGYAECVAQVEHPERKDELTRVLRRELRGLLASGVELPEVDHSQTTQLMDRAEVAAQRFRRGTGGQRPAG